MLIRRRLGGVVARQVALRRPTQVAGLISSSSASDVMRARTPVHAMPFALTHSQMRWASDGASDGAAGGSRGWGSSTPAPDLKKVGGAAIQPDRDTLGIAAEAAKPDTMEVAQMLYDRMGIDAVKLNMATRLLPEEVQDELEMGMKEIVAKHPHLFRMVAMQGGGVGVVKIQNPALPLEFIDSVAEAILASGGEASVAALGTMLSPKARAHVTKERSLIHALEKLPENFIVVGNSHVRVHPSFTGRIERRRAEKYSAIIGDIPEFIVPLAAVAEHHRRSLDEQLAHCREHNDVLELVELKPFANVPWDAEEPVEGAAEEVSEGEDEGPRLFTRVLPPYRDLCTSTSEALFARHRVEDYDAFRLARFLSTDAFIPLSKLGPAKQVTVKPIDHVIVAYPEMFELNQDSSAVRFVLRPDMRPNSLEQFSDRELEERISLLKHHLKVKARIEHGQIKEKLTKAVNAKKIRANPMGCPVMDENVFAMLVYDLLPTSDGVSMGHIGDILPEFAHNTTIRFTRRWFDRFPHLFSLYQKKPPNFYVQRADLELSGDALQTTSSGVKFTDMDAAAIADYVIELGIEIKREFERPVRFQTLTQNLPLALRQHMSKARITYDHVIAQRPDSLMRVRSGKFDTYMLYHGDDMRARLPPCSIPRPLDIISVATNEVVVPADISAAAAPSEDDDGPRTARRKPEFKQIKTLSMPPPLPSRRQSTDGDSTPEANDSPDSGDIPVPPPPPPPPPAEESGGKRGWG